jgi:Tfp pilus assembly protein PilV
MTMARHNFSADRKAQRGITLIIGMILLVLTTLVVLATFHLSRSNTAIVGNAQQRADAVAAAQQTIEAAVNSPFLTSNPEAIFTAPCGQANTLCYDVNGDGQNDVVAQITPQPACVRAQVIPSTSSLLNFNDPADQKCALGQTCSGGSCDNGTNCANTVWDVRAVAQNLGPDHVTPASQGPKSVVNQGVAKRVSTGEMESACPTAP